MPNISIGSSAVAANAAVHHVSFLAVSGNSAKVCFPLFVLFSNAVLFHFLTAHLPKCKAERKESHENR